MKKLTIFALLAALLAGLFCLSVYAEGETANVTVTISNRDLMLIQQPVTVTDLDGDGALTVNDALAAAHDAGYEGGAEAGYGSDTGDYGLYLTKLWGVENGGSYGYTVNHGLAMSLADPVKDGDYIDAYVYIDLENFSDVYCFFENYTETVPAGEPLTLTLYGLGYDENWSPVTAPLAGIPVVAGDEEHVTDADGHVTLTLTEPGLVTVTARSTDTVTLVPPSLTVTVNETAPQTGDTILSVLLVTVAALAGCAVASKKVHGR